MPASGVYAATKAFVASFSDSLWYEQRGRGVYVTALCPGSTQTEMHHRAGGTEADRAPSFMTQTPEEVVDTTLRALRRRRHPVVFSGAHTRVLTNFARRLPRGWLVRLMGHFRRP